MVVNLARPRPSVGVSAFQPELRTRARSDGLKARPRTQHNGTLILPVRVVGSPPVLHCTTEPVVDASCVAEDVADGLARRGTWSAWCIFDKCMGGIS
ncbi:hypothetical protein M407DRAFT_148296 [Tulasnella calospora MUT 4182]|uniref:Uncharacterized protein n=1 Tax=Tulasnella calospora MUT 4182 TaxID=1051891 RepID=A0A0C3PWI1_9AGAM|nr:hypothetical protein M407DRAFT_148296 [Tulasnella calospora MUT 4182]